MKDQFIQCFVDNLAPEDVLILPEPVYYGGTTDRSVSSIDIVRGVEQRGRHAYVFPDRAACGVTLLATARPGDRIIVMGARDDTRPVAANCSPLDEGDGMSGRTQVASVPPSYFFFATLPASALAWFFVYLPPYWLVIWAFRSPSSAAPGPRSPISPSIAAQLFHGPHRHRFRAVPDLAGGGRAIFMLGAYVDFRPAGHRRRLYSSAVRPLCGIRFSTCRSRPGRDVGDQLMNAPRLRRRTAVGIAAAVVTLFIPVLRRWRTCRAIRACWWAGPSSRCAARRQARRLADAGARRRATISFRRQGYWEIVSKPG